MNGVNEDLLKTKSFKINPLQVIEYKEPKPFAGYTNNTHITRVVQSTTRPLRPGEYELLRKELKEDGRAYFDGLLVTGMRHREYQLFLMHPEWFDGNFINLPRIAIKKHRATIKQRYVHLSTKGKTILEYIFPVLKDAPISHATNQSLNIRLERAAYRAGISPFGLNVKAFRKTWESWLVTIYPDKKTEIYLSQGHTEMTSLNHYLNLAFTQEDKNKMLEWVSGFD